MCDAGSLADVTGFSKAMDFSFSFLLAQQFFFEAPLFLI